MSADKSSSNVVPLDQARSLFGSGRSVDQARKDGYTCLTPLERQVAIEFVTTGHTVKQIAADIGHLVGDVRRAFGDPVVRAFIHDLQDEFAQHKMVNAAWVEQQILSMWPQFIGEEPVYMVNKAGEQVLARKFHGPEVASILKHFSGNSDQKKVGGVAIQINFGDVGVSQKAPAIKSVTVVQGDE